VWEAVHLIEGPLANTSDIQLIASSQARRGEVGRARIQRCGGCATDGVAHAPEPFDDRHHWPGSSRSTWSTSLSALGALEEVARGRRDTVVLSDPTGVPENSSKDSGRRCRIGVVVFVAGVRPPARGAAPR
jgi:hypothetical protein